MSFKIYVAVTDINWFMRLRSLQSMGHLDEVNFWQKSDNPFKVLGGGELFLFKLKAPHNMIAGGGIFSSAHNMPLSLAWDAFGPANGAHSLAELRDSILGKGATRDVAVVHRIVSMPLFWDEHDWFEPIEFHPATQQGKGFPTDEPAGKKLWANWRDRYVNAIADTMEAEHDLSINKYGTPQLITPRRGQGAFRMAVTESYRGRCAVSQEKTLPVLDAAHIRPYSMEQGTHEISNGLLLRKDIHTLFDRGYITVTPDYRLRVSDSLVADYGNGRVYYALSGNKILLPENESHHPNRDNLAWHQENLWRG